MKVPLVVGNGRLAMAQVEVGGGGTVYTGCVVGQRNFPPSIHAASFFRWWRAHYHNPGQKSAN